MRRSSHFVRTAPAIIPAIVDTLYELFRLPGQTVTTWLGAHAPDLADLLDIAGDNGGQTVAITVSILAWLAVLLLVAYIVEKIRDFDRLLTSYIVGRHVEALRQIRILRRRLSSAIGLLRDRQEAAGQITVAAVQLPALHARILRCLGSADEGRGMAAMDIASQLKLSSHQVDGVIRRLLQEHLVERGFGTDEGLEVHRITRAGQIYLVEH